MGKKRKLKKRIGSHLDDGESALVVCVGKDCAPREESRAVVEHARAYVKELDDKGESPHVRIAVFGCLGICKKGPIVATLPHVEFHKRVDDARARELIDELARRE